MANSKSYRHNLSHKKSADITLPIIVTATSLLALSYVWQYVISKAANNDFAATQFLYNTGSFLIKLIFPVLCSAIAYTIGSFDALISSIIGGMFVGFGSATPYYTSVSDAVAGFWGCVIIGIIAGYTTLLFERLRSNRHSFAISVISVLIPIMLVITSSDILNLLSRNLNTLSASLIALASKSSAIIAALLIGFMLNIDLYGPFHLAAYLFGAASVATGDPQYMACVASAVMVAPVSAGLYELILYKSRSKKEIWVSVFSVLTGLAGVPQSAVYYYINHPVSKPAGCVAGGCISSVLCIVLGCSTQAVSGGFLSIGQMRNPVAFCISVICGVFSSVTIMIALQGRQEAVSTYKHRRYKKQPLV